VSRIFLSHSSANNAEAVALRDWLKREGWEDVFVDVDPDRGIAPGERWERALNEAASRCEVVLFLVSRDWLASGWCMNEFNLAHKLNKRLFGLLVEDLAVIDHPTRSLQERARIAWNFSTTLYFKGARVQPWQLADVRPRASSASNARA
jgi:TIR domain